MAAAGSTAFSSFLLANKPKSPFFVDTRGCECALQEQLGKEAWRCLLNSTSSIYDGQGGKWFYAVEQSNNASLTEPENSNSNPPDLDVSYTIQDDRWIPFSDADPSENALDGFCTGMNDTQASETFYKDAAALLSGQYDPCFQPGTLPLIIQDAASWNATGCNLGFFCENNSYTRLPTYCPPFPAAQMARLAGQTTPPMGPFEPVICRNGFYCPLGGNKKIKCPAGSFCPQGSYKPTKCSFLSRCPEGSYVNASFLPLTILLLVDLLLILVMVGMILLWRKPRLSKRREVGLRSLKRAISFSVTDSGSSNFHRLDDDDIKFESRITGVKRTPTGFLADRDCETAFGGDGTRESGLPDLDIHQFVKSLSRCTVASNFGLSFNFENLSFQPNKKRKPILSEVSGHIGRGTLWGIMGSSGAGKSTFVNVLMGKQSHTGGITKVNGTPGIISKYKKIIGYVPQDDVVLPELTVRENILHSARIRLPSDWKDVEIQEHVDILLRCLNLHHIKDALVGSPSAPVISGGERKRVSIGLELAAAPMALFLDEPTSGLDATSASSIMTTLKALSRLGITVVAIIHQPRHEIFESLDFVHLMGAGRVIYSGKENEVQTYFEHCGFKFPKEANPADTMMDIIAGEGHLYKKSGDTSISQLIDYWKHWHDSREKTNSVLAPSSVEAAALSKTVKMRGAPWYSQTYFCLCRALLQQYRRKSSFYYEISVAALAGFLIGLAFVTQSGLNYAGMFFHPYELLSSAANFSSVPQMALLVGLAIGLTASSPGVKIFGEEKSIYIRESSSGHNRFAYYIGKVLSTIPRMVLANCHFTILFMLLATPKMSWGAAFVANLLYFYCIYGLASCISMVTRREDGPLIATMASLMVSVISGVSPTLQTVNEWRMLWLWRSSPGTWLAEGYFTENILPWGYIYQIQQAATQSGYHFSRFHTDLLMLFAIGTIYRIIAFMLLRFGNMRSQR